MSHQQAGKRLDALRDTEKRKGIWNGAHPAYPLKPNPGLNGPPGDHGSLEGSPLDRCDELNPVYMQPMQTGVVGEEQVNASGSCTG